jgi:hypothetical protein
MGLVRIAAGVALVLATAAPGTAAPRKSEDPNRQICKTHGVVGSRLKSVRECHTAEQWEEQKLQEQVGLMRKQFNGAPGCRGCDGTKDSPW